MPKFEIESAFAPCGDQPQAIEALASGIVDGQKEQVLLGVTGSGKTFTMAQIIQKVQKPTLILAHNKTLAAQLCSEFRSFFPKNAVEYFVSYYDYYQPEAYIASSDTYIEKESQINEEIDRLRHSATAALTEREDVIVVASVSCIYALGNPEEYRGLIISLREGQVIDRDELLMRLVDIQYTRNDIEPNRATFRVRGDVVDIIPASGADEAIRIEFFGDEIERILQVRQLTGEVYGQLKHVLFFPASHYVTSREKMEATISVIERDLELRLEELKEQDRIVEGYRLKQRTMHDIEMMRELGYCSGIENYSRYFDGRTSGDPPFTLLDYFPKDFVLFIDESHATIPQVRAMYNGDRARKTALVDNGFRLPSAFDNRPLKFEEYEEKTNQIIYVSATPAPYELTRASQVAEQIIRPTGLIDPEVIVRPATGQIDDLHDTLVDFVSRGHRALVTTLTKKLAETVTDFLEERGMKVRYLHSEIETLERVVLIKELRAGVFDVLVGVNLLREGLDMPEVALVAVLDADKEGFLRSETSLIQTIGRAARNVEGQVILYADSITKSMQRAMDETTRRREIQQAYNLEHNITPQSVRKVIHDLMGIQSTPEEGGKGTAFANEEEKQLMMAHLEEQMMQAAAEMQFEKAAKLRDELFKIRGETVAHSSPVQRGKKRRRYGK